MINQSVQFTEKGNVGYRTIRHTNGMSSGQLVMGVWGLERGLPGEIHLEYLGIWIDLKPRDLIKLTIERVWTGKGS